MKEQLKFQLDENEDIYTTTFPQIDKTVASAKLNSSGDLTETEIKYCCTCVASVLNFKVDLWKLGSCPSLLNTIFILVSNVQVTEIEC